MKKKKNRFLLFLCSFVPGLGEMYLGFMKMGVSLSSVFALAIMLTTYTKLGVLTFAVAVIWAYGFFHANNLGSLSDEEFYKTEDVYIFGNNEEEFSQLKDFLAGKYRKGFAIILILLGLSMLWQAACDIMYDILGRDFYYAYISRLTRVISNRVPKVVIAVVVIWFGIKMIQGKKTELDKLEEKEEKNEEKEEEKKEEEDHNER